jgi:hypothetical protein
MDIRLHIIFVLGGEETYHLPPPKKIYIYIYQMAYLPDICPKICYIV